MSTELKENENIKWLLTRIQEASEATESNEIEYDLDEFSQLNGAPSVSIQRQIIYNLHDKGLIKILKRMHDTYGLSKLKAVSGGGFEIEPVGFILEILRPKFEELLKKFGGVKKRNLIIPQKMGIKTIKLDIHDMLLRVNDEPLVNFKSRSKGEGLEKETKQFKILIHLWDFRWEFKNGKVSRKGDIALLQNLQRCCKCPTSDAAYRHTERLNKIFEMHGLDMCIICRNKKCKLEINKV